MDVKRWCLFILLLLLAVATAARGGAESGPDKQGLSYDWSVRADYPRFGRDAIDRKLRDWLENHVNRTVAGAAVLTVDPAHPGGRWDMNVEYRVHQPSERAYSVVFTSFVSPSGAAHPTTTVGVLNFDARDGRQLGLADLFALPERALAIMAEQSPGLARQLVERRQGGDAAAAVPESAWFMDGFKPVPENYATLVLVPDGVRVVFQRYQILPYAYGSVEVDIPLEVLEPAGPSIQYWAKG